MAKIREDHGLIPSILDRLLDDDPETTREPLKGQHQLLRDLRVAVRRDLENLLNTRWYHGEVSSEYDALEQSTVAYGLPDIGAINIGAAAGRRGYLQTVAQAIEIFEPRLKSVRVTELQNADFLDRTLRFRIQAILQGELSTEPIIFDSTLEPVTGIVDIKGEPS